MIRKLVLSTIYSINGFKYAYTHDKSFKLETRSAVLWVAFGWWAWPLSETEFLFLTSSYFLILATELINTALETALKRLHPERHELIGAAKDTLSAAVFLLIIFAIFVAAVIIHNRLNI